MKLTSPDQQIRITRTGLEITADLTFEEWKAMAPRFGAAMTSAAFAIGDWLVYGEDTFRGQMRLPGFQDEDHSSGRIASDVYDAALTSTGLDRSTLATYAYVSRNVPRSLRNEQLSWEYRFHHERRWRADFAHLEARCLIEVEGGIWVNGRHNRAAGFNADLEKYLEASFAGWRVFRFGPDQITMQNIERLLTMLNA